MLALRGVAFDAAAKKLFHAEALKALRRLADALMLDEDRYEIRSNRGGVAVSGEITLHGEELYAQVSLDCRSPGLEVLYRRVAGRKDYRGDRNRWASVTDLLAPDRFAERLRTELGLEQKLPTADRLFV